MDDLLGGEAIRAGGGVNRFQVTEDNIAFILRDGDVSINDCSSKRGGTRLVERDVLI